MQILNRRPPIDPWVADDIKGLLTRTVGVADCDLNRLPKEQALDALALIQKAWIEPTDETHRGGLNLACLDAEEKTRFERHIATAAGLEADHFQKAREVAWFKAEFAKLEAESRRNEQMLRQETYDFFATLRGHLGGHLWLEHAAMLVALLSAFQSGQTLGPGQRFEGRGADLTLVFDHVNYGPLGANIDPHGRIGNWQEVLRHLVEGGNWFALDKSGGREWRLKLGRRAIRAMSGEPRKSERAKARAERWKKEQEEKTTPTPGEAA